MRLARMLANQVTLVEQGLGAILVPAAANRDDAAWLRAANPMPAPSEAALQKTRDAVLARARLPRIQVSEAEAAESALRDRRWHEARERAARALVLYVSSPENRSRSEPLEPLLGAYAEASRQVERERRELMAPGPRFGLVLEGAFTHIEASLPQNILLDVDNANEFSAAAGFRVALFRPSPKQGPPIMGDIHALVEYGFLRGRFDGPTTDKSRSFTRLEARQHRASAELVYRPRVLSRLRPLLRGGPALFAVGARVFDDDAVQTTEVDGTTLGWVAGGGIDVYTHRASGFRAALVALYQSVEHRFCLDPGWEDATNILLVEELARPVDLDCISQQNSDGFAYLLDMSGWNLGLMLAYEF
jgi:hypothetical protein